MDSAIAAFCSTTRTATPEACTDAMISKFRATSAGDRPIDGSSISRSFGRDISARPIATICCSPPDSVPASCARRSCSRGNRPYTRSKSSSSGSPRRSTAPSSRFSLTVSAPNSRRFSGTIATPSLIRRGTGQLVTSSSPMDTRPDLGRTSPRIVFSVVDFPDALPPSRQTSSPGPTDSETFSRMRICP